MKKDEMHAEDPMAAYIQSKKKTKTKKVCKKSEPATLFIGSRRLDKSDKFEILDEAASSETVLCWKFYLSEPVCDISRVPVGWS